MLTLLYENMTDLGLSILHPPPPSRDQKQSIIDQFIAEDEKNKQQMAQQTVQLRQLSIVAQEHKTFQDEVDIWRAKVSESGEWRSGGGGVSAMWDIQD